MEEMLQDTGDCRIRTQEPTKCCCPEVGMGVGQALVEPVWLYFCDVLITTFVRKCPWGLPDLFEIGRLFPHDSTRVGNSDSPTLAHIL